MKIFYVNLRFRYRNIAAQSKYCLAKRFVLPIPAEASTANIITTMQAHLRRIKRPLLALGGEVTASLASCR